MKILFFIMLFLSSQILAQDIVLPLWEDDIPNHRECGEKDILNTDATHVNYSVVTEPNISVFFPRKKKKQTKHAVLIIPGGAYQVIVHEWEGSDIAEMLSKNGITAIVLKYRLPHNESNIIRYKSPLLDAERAMRIIRSHAEEWNINKIGVMGFSAGGHLASTLGTHFDMENTYKTDYIDELSSRPDFMILMYPVITMDSTFTHMGSRNNLLGKNPRKELIDLYSNEKYVSDNTPPTFLVHSTDDKAVPVKNSIEFYTKLQKHRIESEMHIYHYGGHGFSLAKGKGHLESWTNLCVAWIRER